VRLHTAPLRTACLVGPPDTVNNTLRAEDPLVGNIAQEYINNREQHDRTAADWTRRYAQCVTRSLPLPQQSLLTRTCLLPVVPLHRG